MALITSLGNRITKPRPNKRNGDPHLNLTTGETHRQSLLRPQTGGALIFKTGPSRLGTGDALRILRTRKTPVQRYKQQIR